MTMRMGAAVLAAAALAAQAQAASCTASGDIAALHVAALQQTLMVAAYACGESGSYNRFVTEHRERLIASDGRLKAFFAQRGSGPGYDLFKTELANAASLRSIHDPDGFCAAAQDTFAWALDTDQLSGADADMPAAIAAAYRSCAPEGRVHGDGEPASRVSWPHHATLDDRDFDAARRGAATGDRHRHEIELDGE